MIQTGYFNRKKLTSELSRQVYNKLFDTRYTCLGYYNTQFQDIMEYKNILYLCYDNTKTILYGYMFLLNNEIKSLEILDDYKGNNFSKIMITKFNKKYNKKLFVKKDNILDDKLEYWNKLHDQELINIV